MMNAQLKYCPDLRDCVLEDRLVPVIPNMGRFVLTTFGLVLPGSFPLNAIPPGLIMTGLGGMTSFQPGNIKVVLGLDPMQTTGSIEGTAVTTPIGSGASDASAQNIPPVTRSILVTDALHSAPSISRVSGDRSPVLPPGQAYRGGLPVTVPGDVSTEVHDQRSDQGPVKPLPIRLRSRPHRLSSDASGHPVESHADLAP
jgi:hypothetical protein